MEKLEKLGFEIFDGKIMFLNTSIAKIERDGSLTLFIRQNSPEAKTLRLDEVILVLGNPIINIKASSVKKVTSVAVDSDVLRLCKIKYGTLAKALEFAAKFDK